MLLFAALFQIQAFSPAAVSAMGYPSLDTSSHWSIQDWGFSASAGFYVQGAGKSVWTAPGQAQGKTAFYQLAILGVRNGGQEYRLAKPDYLGQMEATSYLVKYANFNVMSGLVVTVVMYFHDNGEFETYAYFQGAAYVPGSPWELIMRIDYDLGDAGNNIAEVLWNPAGEGGGVSPPQLPSPEAADGRLVYASGSGGASYWSATAHEITVAYPPLGQVEGGGIEATAFARILQASHPQFGMVLFGDPQAGLEATFKAYGYYDGTLNPVADPASALQLTGEDPSRPRYAFAGRDQMVFLRLQIPADGVGRFRSKLFQRPASRPLVVRVHQHPAQDLDWTFDPDMVVRNTSDGPRTFRNALADLAGPEDVTVVTSGSGLPYLPYDGYAAPGQAVSETQLHALMSAARNTASINPASVRDWQIDLLVVNWSLQGQGGAWESMFDKGGANVNRIAREGAAVFWPSLGGRGEDFRRGQAVVSALHGAGLALNMDPAWSNCPFTGYCWNDPSACGGVRCGLACPPGADGCRYSAHTCHSECTEGTIMSLTEVGRNTLRFNSSPASGSTSSEMDWYRRAPEAWVKPGRFGYKAVSGPQLPPFIPN